VTSTVTAWATKRSTAQAQISRLTPQSR
jgi:hypothetical protein